jgi:hypothetical protein
MNKTNLTILALAAVFFTGCYYDNFKELHPEKAVVVSNCDSAGVISYSTQIVPILSSACTAQCHNNVGGGHDMTTWTSVNADATNGNLYSSVAWDNTSLQQMPQGATTKISDCDITKIKKWVAGGALNN